MAKNPVKMAFVYRLIALGKRNPFSTVASLIAIFVGIPGAVAGYNYGVALIEPVIPAHRGYVRGEVWMHTDPLLKRVVDIQLAQNDSRSKRLLNDVKQHELELQSEQAKQTPQYRALIQQQIERTKAELHDIDEENQSLFKEKKAK